MSANYVSIIELDGGGHRMNYVRILLEEVLRRGQVPLLVVGDGLENYDEYRTHLRHLGPLAIEQASSMREALRKSCAVQATKIIIPDGDRHLVSLVFQRRASLAKCRLLLLRAVDSTVSVPRRIAKRALVAWLASFGRCTVLTLASAVKTQPALGEVRDPVSISATPAGVGRLRGELRTLGGQREVTWIGVMGEISARKNLDLLADAIVATTSPSVYGVLLVGRFAPDYNAAGVAACQRLSAAGVIVHHINSYVSEDTFDEALTVVDLVAVLHANEGPSGILAKAAGVGTFILCGGAESLKRDARELGPDRALWTVLDQYAVARCLSEIRRPAGTVRLSTESEFAVALLGSP